MDRYSRRGTVCLCLGVTLLCWQLLYSLLPTSFWTLFFSSPARIFLDFFSHFTLYREHIWATGRNVLSSLLLSLFFLPFFCWLLSRYILFRSLFSLFYVWTQNLPLFVFAPLMLLLFDWSPMATLLPTTWIIFLPLLSHTYKAWSDTPQVLLDFFWIHNASKWKEIYFLRLPWIIPHLFHGLRLASVMSVAATLSCELGGAQSGLGVLLYQSRREICFEGVWATLFLIFFLSLSLYETISIIEWIFFRKYKQQRFDIVD